MEGIPVLRDGMVVPKLRTSLHPGGDPERVESVEKVHGTSRGNEQEEDRANKNFEKPRKVTLGRLASDPIPEDETRLEEAPPSDSTRAIVRAWAQRTEFVARTASAGWAEDKRQAMIVAHEKAVGSGTEFDVSSVTA